MKKASTFLALTYLLSWPVAFLAFGGGVKANTAPWFVAAIYFMFTPLISAVVTQRLVFRQRVMRPLRVSFRPNRWFLVALLLPSALAAGSTAASLLFPGVSLTADPVQASSFRLFAQNLPPERLEEITRSAAEAVVHPFFLILLGGTIAGLTVNGLAGFGEELGWRGLLLRELAPLGFWRASLAIGAAWGLWHLPFVVHGHNYPGHPVAGVLMMTAWTILFSPLIGYVCIRADSVVAAAILHGALNGTVGAPLIVLRGGDPLRIGVMGAAGLLVLAGLNAALFVFGRPGEWQERWMARTPDGGATPLPSPART